MTEQPTAGAPQSRFVIDVTPEIEAGHHADFVSVWHTRETFVLDFAALRRPPELKTDEDGTVFIELLTRIVARVRLAPEQIFEIMKALEAQLSKWEIETGHRPAPESEGGQT